MTNTKEQVIKDLCDYCEGTGKCCSSCGESEEFCYCDREEKDIRKCHACKGTGIIKNEH